MLVSKVTHVKDGQTFGALIPGEFFTGLPRSKMLGIHKGGCQSKSGRMVATIVKPATDGVRGSRLQQLALGPMSATDAE
jgi:hypothetical protein